MKIFIFSSQFQCSGGTCDVFASKASDSCISEVFSRITPQLKNVYAREYLDDLAIYFSTYYQQLKRCNGIADSFKLLSIQFDKSILSKH